MYGYTGVAVNHESVGSSPAPGAGWLNFLCSTIGVSARVRDPKYLNWIVSESRRKLKLKAIAYKGGGCARCGYDKCPVSLVFHHEDPSVKEFGVATQIRSWAKVKAELDKTTLLCANCHGETHHELNEQVRLVRQAEVRQIVPERVPRPEHGSHRGYQTNGCRCEACVRWNRDRQNSRKLLPMKPTW